MASYCDVTDLTMMGDLPLPSYIVKEAFVQDAADEIDSQIGTKYTTPVDMDEAGPVSRPARLLLKRINKFLANGRLLLAIATTGEDTQLHSYGRYLVRTAEEAIKGILNGTIDLDGAEETPGEAVEYKGPMIANVDPYSMVEEFQATVSPYGMIDASRRPWYESFAPRAGG